MLHRKAVRAVVRLLIVASMIPSIPSLFAQDALREGDEWEPITAYHFEGLSRTDEEEARRMISVPLGIAASPATVRKIEEDLLESELFATVEAQAERDPETGDTVVRITVQEKWTLIPLPFFSTDGDSMSGGVAVIESNLFGNNQQLIGAAIAGSGGFSGFLSFSDPRIRDTPWGYGVNIAGGQRENEWRLPSGERLRTTEYNQLSTGASLSYRLRALILSVGIGWRWWHVIKDTPQRNQRPAKDGYAAELAPSVRLTLTRPHGVFRRGITADILGQAFAFTSGWKAGASFEWAIPTTTQQRVRLLANGEISELPAVVSRSISGRDGYRTLPFGEITASHHLSGAVFYDLPVLIRSWGALVLTGGGEIGAYDDEDISLQRFGGPTGGIRIYLQQIALPALGIDFAYSLVDHTILSSFSFGVGM